MQQQRWSYRDAWTRASRSTPRSESFDLGEHSGQVAQLNFLALVVALCPFWRVLCRRSRYPAAQRSSNPPLGPDHSFYSIAPPWAR
jgi:hypothetical protein